MSPNQLKIGSIMALLAGVIASFLVMQHRNMRDLRKENASLRAKTERLAQLVSENEELSYRLANARTARTPSGDTSPELLRLRGQVTLLRRELEVPQRQRVGTSTTPEALASAPPDRQLLTEARRREVVRIEGQAEYVRLKALVASLQEKASDPVEDRARALAESGVRDSVLISMCEQLAIAQLKLGALQQERDAQDVEVQVVNEQVADLKIELANRSEMILKGLNVKADSLKASLESMPTEVDKGSRILQ